MRSRGSLHGSCPLLSLFLLAAAACGDDGSGGGTSDGSSTGSATTSAPPSDGTSTTDDGSSTAPADSTGGTSSSSGAAATSTGTDDQGSSSSGETTGPPAFDVPFDVLDPYPLPLTLRVQPGWIAITDAAQWDALTGQPVPAGIDFERRWLLLGSRGPLPFPGHALEVSALTWDAGVLTVDGLAVDPAVDCETFQFTWPADTLLAIDALEVEVNDFDDQTTPTDTSCAMGAGEAMSCDLQTPCATGQLCAGLVRSTVLANSPGGLCGPASHSGIFGGGGLSIPPDGSIAETSVVVDGLTSVDTDVVIWVQLDHPAPEELVIELRNPDTNQVTVADLQASALHPGGVGIVPVGFSGDESVNGTWWLVVRDDIVNGNNGAVLSWELEIMSRFD